MTLHTILPGKLYQRGHLLRFSLEDKKALLKAHNITVVVGLARAHDTDLHELLGDTYIWHRIPDGKIRDARALEGIRDAALDLQDLMGGAILCYCSAGRNRSGLMNAMLLMKLTGCSGAEAIEHVRTARPNAIANAHFTDFLDPIL